MNHPTKRARHSNAEEFPLDLPTLTTISDNCLLGILKCLDISDILCLSSTCRKLRRFIAKSYFSKVNVRLYKNRNKRDTHITVTQLTKLFEHFGKNIEHITVTGRTSEYNVKEEWHLDFKAAFQKCRKLHTLSLRQLGLGRTDKLIFSGIRPSIRVLELKNCDGNTDCMTNLVKKRSTKLHTVAFTGHDCYSYAVLKNCSNLSNLTVQYWPDLFEENLAIVLKANQSSLCKLKLINCSHMTKCVDIVQNMPNLKFLSLKTGGCWYCTRERHLKSLNVKGSSIEFGSIMRALSDRSAFESIDLSICGNYIGDFTELLHFEKLHTLRLSGSTNNTLNLLQQMQMPALRHFSFSYPGSLKITTDNTNNISSFLESKPALNSMVLVDYAPYHLPVDKMSRKFTFELILQIIEMLKIDRNRPLVKLFLSTSEFGGGIQPTKEEVTQTSMIVLSNKSNQFIY